MTVDTAAAPAANAATLQELIDGNKRFMEGTLQTCKADKALVQKLANGQNPKAIVLACSDSRCPPELLFDQGLGDLFVVRVAGNLVGQHAMGSILYAVQNLGTRVVVVLGHTKCGAVAATVDLFNQGKIPDVPDAEDPISSLVADIHPVVHHCHTNGHADKDDAGFKHEVAKHNSVVAARAVVKGLAKQLPAEMQTEVTVVAAIYNIEHGGVDTLEVLAVAGES